MLLFRIVHLVYWIGYVPISNQIHLNDAKLKLTTNHFQISPKFLNRTVFILIYFIKVPLKINEN